MLPHSKLDLCASLDLSISVLQDTKPPAASQKHRLRGEVPGCFHTAKLHLMFTPHDQKYVDTKTYAARCWEAPTSHVNEWDVKL